MQLETEAVSENRSCRGSGRSRRLQLRREIKEAGSYSPFKQIDFRKASMLSL